MGASVIIAAADSAQRMNGIDKILCEICGKQTILHSILAFDKSKCVEKIVVVTSKDKIDVVKDIIQSLKLNNEICVVEGSNSRQRSVICGFEHCIDSDCVMIHDAARPMITSDKIDSLYEHTIIMQKNAVTLAVKSKDTVKIIDDNGKIISTPDRDSLYNIQTPQAFKMSLYKRAVKAAVEQNLEYTDDCQLIEALGENVFVLEGDYKNIKITTPEDIITAENFLKEQNND